MDYVIHSEIPGRIRARLAGPVPETHLDALIDVAGRCPFVRDVRVYALIGQIAVTYAPAGAQAREAVLAHLASIDERAVEEARSGYVMALAPRTHRLFLDLASLAGSYFARKWLLPGPVRALLALASFRPFLRAALAELKRRRLTVPVLDAAAIGVSFAKLDYKTAGQTMFLLEIGETLEAYTKAASENELIGSLLDAPETASKVDGDVETQVDLALIAPGDLVAVRTGSAIAVDGVVERGRALVNQAALTGEPLAVERREGDDVFAGTVVEEGDILVRVRAKAGETKLRQVVSLVQRADSLKAASQSRMEAAADRIVPWNFALAAAVGLATRSLSKASAALMVDYSCALKLTGSIAVMSAMSEAAKAGIMAKGACYFERFSQADTIVFDKTGTLTEASPRLAKVVATDGWPEDEILRFAACLEEHFPHPVARAVVRAAEERGLEHRERHAAVEYIVAHGIASRLDGKRVAIGSRHFVIEDEGARLDAAASAALEDDLEGLSPLYLAVDGAVVGVLGIEDPLKPGVAEALAALRGLGLRHIVMLTGDSHRTAARIAREAGIDEFRADMLPEDKFAYVEALVAQGRRVAMVGDGVNDSPALARADVGIAMGQGSDIAKEAADIIVTASDLAALVDLRLIADGLMKRMTSSYRKVIGVNSALLALGVGGLIAPQTSSLLHNASTVAFSAASTKRYLPRAGAAGLATPGRDAEVRAAGNRAKAEPDAE